jgi:hypothetical protein
MASCTFNYDIDFPPLPIHSIVSSSVLISIKMMSGDIISITISTDITIKQFYEFIWRIIPERIDLQCLNLFRMDSEESLLPTSTLLYPQKDEIFYIYIEIHPHLSLRVDFESNGYYHDICYQSYEVLIYACYPTQLESIETDISKRAMYDGMYYHPLDRNGCPIPHGPRYKAHLIRFFVRDIEINNKRITSFYSNEGIHFIGQMYENDYENWFITVDDNKQSLKRLGDLFNDMPISQKEKAILAQAIEDEWAKMESEQ